MNGVCPTFSRPSFPHPVRAVVFFGLVVVFNLASIWYLARRTFRTFAHEFVLERERAGRVAALEKKLRRGK
jgi:hypothetical protein